MLVGVVPPPNLPAETDLEQIFLEAYRRLHGRVLTHAERFLNKEDALDAVGDAVLSLWTRWTSLTPEQRSDKYVFGVVHYCVYAKLRTIDPLISFEDAEDELDQLAASAVPGPTRGDTPDEVLDATLKAMPRCRREVLLLLREEGLAYQEAAEALGVSIGTINSHYRLAMEDIRAAFTRAGFRIADVRPKRLPSSTGEANHD